MEKTTSGSKMRKKQVQEKRQSAKPSASTAPGKLILGWRVTSSLAPKYWLSSDAKPGGQSAEDIVGISAKSIARHTAIVAQSGSGKSFFLGRLIEEILIETKARCVILDPNGDFRKMAEVASPLEWVNACYDHQSSTGSLPHESTGETFSARWSKIDKRFLVGPNMRAGKSKETERIKLSWASISMDFLAEDVSGMARNELYHCHQFTKPILVLLGCKSRLLHLRKSSSPPTQISPAIDAFDKAKKIYEKASAASGHDRIDSIRQEFSELLNNLTTNEFDQITARTDLHIPYKYFGEYINRVIKQAATAADYVTKDVAHYYFGKAKEYSAQGILQSPGKNIPGKKSRLEVIDLSSFRDRKISLLALNSILATEWDAARLEWERALMEPAGTPDLRVPTFIVVDEAHNFVSQQPRGLAAEALREQFRTIAAEGRKYGIFLILCTQRPDKIDPLVLSECENKSIMRLGSRSVLDITKNLLGLEDIPPTLLAKTLEFEKGRALLIGPWTETGSELIYGAMRRTLEGGKNLQASHWASPYPQIGNLSAPSKRIVAKPPAKSKGKVKKVNKLKKPKAKAAR